MPRIPRTAVLSIATIICFVIGITVFREDQFSAELLKGQPASTVAGIPPSTWPSSDSNETATKERRENRRLVVLVPATTSEPNLCKFLLSAVALGYPAPIIINWGLDYREISKWEGGKNLSKIPGILQYLEALLRDNAHPDDRLQEDDIVLIADGYDTWFQLPPEVLIKRFHEINEEANAKLRKQWGKKKPMPMQQTIIAASQKKCYPPPESYSVLHCDKLPESPLRTDLYGPNTDKVLEPDNYHDVRPRFINGGSYLGLAGDLRRMFRRIQSKLDDGIGKGLKMYSEQGISGEVLGEQELWRQWRREHNSVSDEMMALIDREFEYHIGLDYHQQISIATVFGAIDGEIIRLNNQSEIAEHSARLGISPVRLQGVPDDIRNTQNPLGDVLETVYWGDMPLYADFFTESVPVTLHHNSHKGGLKQRRILWWDRMWFFKHLRSLLTIRLKPSKKITPLATVLEGDEPVYYWAPDSDRMRRKPRFFFNATKDLLPEIPNFDTVCRHPEKAKEEKQHWWDEVFRDGKGSI